MMRRALLFLLLFWGSAAGAANAVALPMEGRPAPPFDITLLDGGDVTLDAVRGEVVLITLWATWCGPCRHEMPVLDAYYRKHRNQGLRVVAVSVDDPFAEAKVRRFMAPFALPLALAHDAHLGNYGRIGRIPLIYLIDRNGVLRRSGWFSETAQFGSDLERVVTPLLREQRGKP